MSESFFSFLKMKMAEYDRQLAEGADSAPLTKEENERFQETFLSGPVGHRPVAVRDEKPQRASRKNKKCNIL